MWLDLLMFIRKNKEIGGFGKVYLSHLTSDVAKQNVNNIYVWGLINCVELWMVNRPSFFIAKNRLFDVYSLVDKYCHYSTIYYKNSYHGLK